MRVLCWSHQENHSKICVSIDLTEFIAMNIDAINKIGIYDKYGDDAPKFQKREEKKICKHKTQR